MNIMFVFIQRLFANVLFANLPFSAKITAAFSLCAIFFDNQYTYSTFNVLCL
jgi:hypothetical protein